MTIAQIIAAKKAAASKAEPAQQADPMLEAAIARIDPPSLGKRRAGLVLSASTPLPAVLTISQRLAANARKLREKPCPPNHCDHCYRHSCRLLLASCCICNGGVSLSKTNFFPRTP